MDGIRIFKQHAESIQAHFPDLFYAEDECGVPFVSGKLLLKDAEGQYIDHYEIRIIPVFEYPNSFPLVFETAGRIPINFDWHVFEQDGHCCIRSLPEELLACKAGLDLAGFIKSEVIPYFFNQKHKELYGYFLKERPHGDDGHIDFFRETFQTHNLLTIMKGLAILRSQKLPTRVAKCFCGSGLKYRSCHRGAIRECSKFNPSELDHFGKMVTKAILLQ